MAYTDTNFKSKKALKEALAEGKEIRIKPDLFPVPTNGKVFLEGPHFPQPHTWYAEGTLKDGVLVSVK